MLVCDSMKYSIPILNQGHSPTREIGAEKDRDIESVNVESMYEKFLQNS